VTHCHEQGNFDTHGNDITPEGSTTLAKLAAKHNVRLSEIRGGRCQPTYLATPLIILLQHILPVCRSMKCGSLDTQAKYGLHASVLQSIGVHVHTAVQQCICHSGYFTGWQGHTTGAGFVPRKEAWLIHHSNALLKEYTVASVKCLLPIAKRMRIWTPLSNIPCTAVVNFSEVASQSNFLVRDQD